MLLRFSSRIQGVNEEKSLYTYSKFMVIMGETFHVYVGAFQASRLVGFLFTVM